MKDLLNLHQCLNRRGEGNAQERGKTAPVGAVERAWKLAFRQADTFLFFPLRICAIEYDCLTYELD